MMVKPFVSCVCVTRNRRLFLRRALAYYMRAAEVLWTLWETPSELVILDGSEKRNPEWRPYFLPREMMSSFGYRYFHEPMTSKGKVGYCHNRVTELAQGDLIIRWDDDDWHSPNRIVQQMQALQLQPDGCLAFTSKFYAYHLAERKACKSRTWFTGGGSMGSAFAYHKKVWEKCPFRDVDEGEDNHFWTDIEAAKVPMVDMFDPNLFVYIRHNRNGSYLVNVDFTEEDMQAVRTVLDDNSDLNFYDELSEILPVDNSSKPHPFVAMQALYSSMGKFGSPFTKRYPR